MTDPEFAIDLHRAAHRRDSGEDHRCDALPRCCPPWAARRRSIWPWSSTRPASSPPWRRDDRGQTHAIAKGEDRELFKQAMLASASMSPAPAPSATWRRPARRRAARPVPAHHPAVVHPRRLGRRHRYNREEFERIAANGLDLSPVHEVLVEECLLGWKEVRDGGHARPQGPVRRHLRH